MKISGSYAIPASQERTWSLLQDPDVLARCMPGTDRLERTGEDQYEMRMKMAIAAISGSFDGKVRLAEKEPPHTFRLLVEGNGKIGFLKGDGVLQLSPEGDSATTVQYSGDVQVGGGIAAVGQRLLDTTSRMIIRKFFEKLSEAAATA